MLVLAGTPHALAQPDRPALETVTVWAQKRESSLEDVPMAMSTMTAAEVADRGIDNIDDVAAALPALDMQRSVGPVTTTLRIRRVGNLGNIPTFEPAVGLFVDGAFRSRSLLSTADLLDVERIEVLHGPQSTLYGKNASAGVLAIYTRRPTADPSTAMEVTTGLLDVDSAAWLYRASGSVSGPLSGQVGASLSASYSGYDHTITNALAGPDGNDRSRATGRGQIEWTPNDRLMLRVLVGYLRERDDQGESDVHLVPGARSWNIANALQQLDVAASCPDNEPRNRVTCSVATNQLDLEAADVTVLARYRLPNGWALDSVSGWDRYEDRRDEDDVVQLYTPLLFFHDSERATSVQQELRLSSDDEGAVSWLAGAFYYNNHYARGSGGARAMFGPNGPAAFLPLWPATLGLPLALPDQLGLHDSRLDTDYYSAFGQITWNMTDRFSLTGGLRWQREDKSASIENSVTRPGASVVSVVFTPSVSPGGEPVNGRISRSTDNVSWRVTSEYRFDASSLGYLTVASGFRSGGFNNGFGSAPLRAREFGDETSRHYELGVRSMLAQDRVRMSASVFYTRYDDYQDAAFVSSQFTVGNADRLDLRGFELEGRALLGSGTTMTLALSYADLVYETNTTGMCYPGRVADGSLPRSCDLSGEHPVAAPPWSISAGLQHVHETTWGNLFARLDWSWTDHYNSSFSSDPRMNHSPYHLVGARLGTRIGDYELMVWGDNLLDENVVYFDSVLNLFDDASFQSFLGDPRSFGLTLRMRF